MTAVFRRGFEAAKAELKSKSKLSGWVLEKQTTSFADQDKWSNIDQDVTPAERRTWTSWTVLGFWISDAMNTQVSLNCDLMFCLHAYQRRSR